MHNGNSKPTQPSDTCLDLRRKCLAARLCSQPQVGCCGTTVGLSWLVTEEALITARRETWICGCLLAQHRIRAVNFISHIAVFCWGKLTKKPIVAGVVSFGCIARNMLKICIFVGERWQCGGSKACPVQLLVQADVPCPSSGDTLGGPQQGPSSWHAALCRIPEHRA